MTYNTTNVGSTKIIEQTYSGTTTGGAAGAGTTTGGADFEIDYTLLFERMVSLLTSIDSHISSIDSHISSIDSHISSIEQLADGRKQPSNQGGIATSGTTSSSPSGFTRAMTVNALKESGQLEKVIAEYNNPTPVPGM